jgi:luciferase family oxidoreductase group 1
MEKFSILDLVPIPDGSEAKDALHNAGALAVAIEKAGYHRYWVAEHHNTQGLASSATTTIMGYLASKTHALRIGSGGIMLPNHAPLVVAEQFGTLAAIYGDRFDLGLGRAPGTDMGTAQALRRHMANGDTFPQDVQEIMTYLGNTADQYPVKAIPGKNSNIPVWILGSSLYGAQLAAYLGLPYAFASHFAPDYIEEALAVYREQFQPSERLQKPYAMIGINAWAAETDEEAEYISSSHKIAFSNIVTNNRGKTPRPVENVQDKIAPSVMSQVSRMLAISSCGGPEKLRQELSNLVARFAPDEVIITNMIHDPAKRMRSFEITADALKSI